MAAGNLEAIVGCMFSGKTTALIERLEKAQKEGKKLQVFKPRVDTRDSADHIVSHDMKKWQASSIAGSIKILEQLERGVDVVAVDEAQFFDEFLPQVLNVLVMKGKTVLVAGLDTDWRGQPFGPIPTILSLASKVTKMYAECSVCKAPAVRSQRIVESDEDILIGREEYEPRCLEHFRVSNLQENTWSDIERGSEQSL